MKKYLFLLAIPLLAGCTDSNELKPDMASTPQPEITLTPEQEKMIEPYKTEERDPLVELLMDAKPTESSVEYELDSADFLSLWKEKSGVLIDLRTPEEIEREPKLDESAENFNYYAQGFGTQFRDIDPSTPIFLYCAHGHRSKDVQTKLLKLGFTEVYHLDGGMSEY